MLFQKPAGTLGIGIGHKEPHRAPRRTGAVEGGHAVRLYLGGNPFRLQHSLGDVSLGFGCKFSYNGGHFSLEV